MTQETDHLIDYYLSTHVFGNSQRNQRPRSRHKLPHHAPGNTST